MPDVGQSNTLKTHSYVEQIILNHIDLIISELTFHLGAKQDTANAWGDEHALRRIFGLIYDAMPVDFRVTLNQSKFVEFCLEYKSALQKKYFEEQLLDDISERFAQNDQLGELHY